MSLAQPTFLWLLPLVVMLWFLPSRVRDIRHGLCRSMVVILTILALTRPAMVTTENAAHHVLVLDASGSVPASEQAQARGAVTRLLGGLEGGAHCTLVEVGGDPGAGDDPRFDAHVRIAGGGGSRLGLP